MQDETLFHCSISREIPPSLLLLERVIDTLDATQEVPRHYRLYSRGTMKVPAQLKKSPVFASSSRVEGPFPCFVEKGILAFPSHLKGRRSQLESREELQGSCHHSKRPPMSQCTPDTADFPALARGPPRGLTQNTMAGVTALWRLERKPPIPLDNTTGSLTLLL